MQALTKASNELFRRSADERFESVSALHLHCQAAKGISTDHWRPPGELQLAPLGDDVLHLTVGDSMKFQMNDWSFSQLCRLANVNKDTVNRLSPGTATKVFGETLPTGGSKPLQLFTEGGVLRSIHGTTYTRVYDADLLAVIEDYTRDFQPPQKGSNGGTGLYRGEQDMFCFLIDPTGWAEINGEAFAPGFFIWNSEVGRRSIGIQTFWFQAICQNHIVWDAIDVVDFSRKHTSKVHESFGEIRRLIETLAEKREERRDGFVKVVANAMEKRLGRNAAEAMKALLKNGIPKSTAKKAMEIAEREGRFTIFALVDALTRVTGEIRLAGDRMEADTKASSLLALAV